jgi:hypothetical protein
MMHEYLSFFEEPIPQWLVNFPTGQAAERLGSPIRDFFRSRVCFYPGSGGSGFFDTQPLDLFCIRSRSIHCFVYADYLVKRSELTDRLDSGVPLVAGYRSVARVPWSGSPRNSRSRELQTMRAQRIRPVVRRYGFLEVFQREEGRDEGWGPVRFAVLFLGDEACDVLQREFGGRGVSPHAVILQDCRFGGHWVALGGTPIGERWGLEGEAIRCGIKPFWALVEGRTEPWAGYRRLDLPAESGGMHSAPRVLYELG